MAGMALAALIDAVREGNGWSSNDIARRAEKAGYKLTDNDISVYKTKGMRTIVPKKIEALAYGLNVPAWRVVVAALVDKGIDLPLDVRRPEDAIQADPTLPEATKSALMAILTHARRG